MAERLVRVTHSHWLSYVEIEPPLDTFQQFVTAYIVINDVPAPNAEHLNDEDFLSSQIDDVTEFRLRGVDAAVLDCRTERLKQLFVERHNLALHVGNLAVR